MLHIHRAERADQLVGALAEMLGEPLDDPLATEVIAVLSQGIERWISQEPSLRLGGGALGSDGVCANGAFPLIVCEDAPMVDIDYEQRVRAAGTSRLGCPSFTGLLRQTSGDHSRSLGKSAPRGAPPAASTIRSPSSRHA